MVGGNEVGEVLPELIVGLVVEAFDRSVLDRAIHPFDLSIGPMMLGVSRTMLDAVRGAAIFEGMRPEAFAVGDSLLICGTAEVPPAGPQRRMVKKAVTFGRQRLARQKAIRSCNR